MRDELGVNCLPCILRRLELFEVVPEIFPHYFIYAFPSVWYYLPITGVVLDVPITLGNARVVPSEVFVTSPAVRRCSMLFVFEVGD